MAKLTEKVRKALSPSKFAESAKKKYPIENKSHAANAKARASEMENKSKISVSTKAKIDAKANKILDKKKK